MVKKYKAFEPQLEVVEPLVESAIVLTNEAKLSLYKKSQKSGIATDILEEVYRRGFTIWNESFAGNSEQFGFDRVNSFISGGFAADLDEDLMIDEGKRGLWDNIHAKQNRIKNGSGEHMRKPGSKGAPTADALKNSQTEEAMKARVIHKGKHFKNAETSELQSNNPNDSDSRFDGTTSAKNVYTRETPGQVIRKTIKEFRNK
jgi:hypothetical protein